MTAHNPQAGPLTGLDVGADGAGLPHPAPRQPRIIDEAHGALMAYVIETRSADPHPDEAHDYPWACQHGEGIFDGWTSQVDCVRCSIAALASINADPLGPIDQYDDEGLTRTGTVEAWQAAREYAEDFSDHPAAVHMQRIATELELRYGLGIEVRP